MQEDSYQVIFRYQFGLRSDILRAMFTHSHKIETHASKLSQYIETSLRFSKECWVIPKTREQPSSNTHATRDLKGKSVIGESSMNAKGSQYFKCQRLWPSRNLLFREADDEIEKVVYEPTGSVTDSDDVRVFSIQLSVIRCSHTAVRDEDWRRSSVFHTYTVF